MADASSPIGSAPATILITGIMGAGKSTVAQALAERLPRSVHLRGDAFRRMIVNGAVAIEPPLSDEAYAQLRLRYEISAMAAARYCAAGFTVVYQDVVLGPLLAEVVALHCGWPLYVVVLAPSAEVALARDAARAKHAYRGWTPDALDAGLRAETPRIGLWLDTSGMTVAETVDAIFARPAEAFVG